MRHSMRCPKCRKGQLEYRTLRLTGDRFLICERYPKCSYVGDLIEDGDDPARHPEVG